MKKGIRIIGGMIFFVTFIIYSPGFASEEKERGEENLLWTITKVGLGFVSSMAAHEGGHWIVDSFDDSFDKSLSLKFQSSGKGRFGSWESKYGSASTTYHLAGLSGQVIFTEGLMLIPKKERGAFWWSAILTNMVWEFSYPLLRSGSDDLRHIVKRESSIFVVHVSFTFYRLLKNILGEDEDKFGFCLFPVPRGDGIMIGYSWRW